jgi:hypothetical protein
MGTSITFMLNHLRSSRFFTSKELVDILVTELLLSFINIKLLFEFDAIHPSLLACFISCFASDIKPRNFFMALVGKCISIYSLR